MQKRNRRNDAKHSQGFELNFFICSFRCVIYGMSLQQELGLSQQSDNFCCDNPFHVHVRNPFHGVERWALERGQIHIIIYVQKP